MSAPVYVHPASGARFVLLGTTPIFGAVALVRLDQPAGDASSPLWVVDPERFGVLFHREDDLLDLAEAVVPAHEVPPAPGEQPRSEFSSGPVGNGPAWADDRLAAIVDRWSRDLSGGVA